MFKLKNSVILLNMALLTACASNGGSFEVDTTTSNQANTTPTNTTNNAAKPSGGNTTSGGTTQINKVKQIISTSSTSTSSTNTTADANTTNGSTNSQNSAKQYQDDVSLGRRVISPENEQAFASLGFEAKIPRRNQLGGVSEPIGDITPIAGSIKNLPNEDEVKGYGSDEDSFIHSHDGKKLHRERPMEFVRSGYLLHLAANLERNARGVTPRFLKTGPHGYVYYLGNEPSTAMPAQTATYKGTWDFTTTASTQNQSDYFGGGRAGIDFGATPEDNQSNVDDKNKPVGHSSEFQVNFSEKTLSGKLTKNGYVEPRSGDQEITPMYKIEAKLNGNRFSGKATALEKDDPYFGKDSSQLDGGFYGPKAQELAGKFLADDQSIFVVFAAKREAADGDSEQKFDSIQVRLSDLQKSPLDTFGQATHLVINGVKVALIPEGKTSFAEMAFNDNLKTSINDKNYNISVCCNNLDYVKFGTFAEEGQGGYQYLVGERTAAADLPKGNAHYRGTWNGVIYSKDNHTGGESPNNTAGGTRSLFDVDFSAKTINGKLIAEDGLDDRPMLTLSGELESNGFSGRAKTGETGFNLDKNSTAGGTVVHLDAPFSGGFYGPQAVELGGIVHSAQADKDKVSITFGAKRQVEK